MRVKRFEAPDARRALAMVKAELGEDAVILSNRTVTAKQGRGSTGISRYVEVVAAKDDDLEKLTRVSALYGGKEKPAGRENGSRQSTSSPRFSGEAGTGEDETGDVPIFPLLRSRAGQRALNHEPATDRTEGVSRAPGRAQERPVTEDNPKPHQGLRAFLASGRSEEKNPSSLPGPAMPQDQPGKPRQEEVARWRDALVERILVEPLMLDTFRQGPAVIALVGPTGVGKTTTAAKLAAWFTLREGLKTTLLSMDCYRIGATDQLRTYARIMGLPCEIAINKKDFRSAIARHWNQDLILVDTAGKSPYDNRHIEELAQWFAIEAPISSYLTVSATTKKEDLEHILEKYRALAIKGLMVTKLDETRAYATLCQCLAATDMPVSCLGTGQRVPEDFLMASRPFLDTLFKRGWAKAMSLTGPGSNRHQDEAA